MTGVSALYTKRWMFAFASTIVLFFLTLRFYQEFLVRSDDTKGQNASEQIPPCWRRSGGGQNEFAARILVYDVGDGKHIVLIPISLKCKTDPSKIMPYLYPISISFSDDYELNKILESFGQKRVINIYDIFDIDLKKIGFFDIEGNGVWISNTSSRTEVLRVQRITSLGYGGMLR